MKSQFNSFKFLAAALLSLLCFRTSAQDLQKVKRYSHLTYIFKLDPALGVKIYKEQAANKHLKDFWGPAIDSVNTDSIKDEKKFATKYGFGQFLFVRAVENKLDYKIVSINSFESHVFVDPKNVLLKVYKLNTSQLINNAVVYFKGSKIKFDESLQAYPLPHFKGKGFLRIALGEENEFSFVKNDSYGRYYRSRRYRSRYPSYEDGYLALNKPMYLPGDTVKIKAFLIDKKGKPVTGKLKLRMKDRQDWFKEPTVIAEVDAKSPGVYMYEYILPDSLKIDKEYMIRFEKGKKEIVLAENKFDLKDYQLDEANYDLRVDKKNYRTGEKVVVFASGKDANGFNLLDARVEFKVEAGSISHFYANRVIIPNEIWTYKTVLDPDGETQINIPDSVLPKVQLQLELKAEFFNSNNEGQTIERTITYYGGKEKLNVELDSGFVKVDHIKSKKGLKKQVSLYKVSPTGTEVESKVMLPYKEKLDPLVKKYEFVADSSYGELEVVSESAKVDADGLRTHDSIFITFSNVHGIDVSYIIKKGEKVIKKGVTKTLDWKARDASFDTYKIDYHYLWAGAPIDNTDQWDVKEKKLNVEIEQAESVSPGQTIPVKIKVTDYKDQPVKDVDLTALALNSQFKESNLPTITYKGKNRSLPEEERSYEFDQYFGFLDGSFTLTEKWRARMHLDTMHYYKFIYPGSKCVIRDSVNSFYPQISPFLYKNGSQVPIFTVHVDDRLMYYYDTYNAYDYVFPARAGYKTIRLRCYDKVYVIDSVLLQRGIKTDLSINIDSLPKHVKVYKVKPRLSRYEKLDLQQNVFHFQNYSKKPSYIWQRNRVLEIPPANEYSLRNFNIGGFTADSAYYAVQNGFVKRILLEPGYVHTVTQGLIKLRSYEMFKGKMRLYRYSPPSHAIGMKAMQQSDVVLQAPTFNLNSSQVRAHDWKTREGLGSFQFEFKHKVSYNLIALKRRQINESYIFFHADQTTLHNLEPGNYTVLFIRADHHFLKMDSVQIKADARTFRRTSDTSFKAVITDNPAFFDLMDFMKASKTVYRNKINWSGNLGEVSINLIDADSKESIPFANVIAYQNNIQYAVAVTDFNGVANIKLPPGTYDIKAVYVGYDAFIYKNVLVKNGLTTDLEMQLKSGGGVRLDEVEVVNYNMPRGVTRGGMFSSRRVSSFYRAPRRKMRKIRAKFGGSENAPASYGDERFLNDGAETYYYSVENVAIDGDFKNGKEIDVVREYEESGDLKNEMFADSSKSFVHDAQAGSLGNNIRSKFIDYAYWQPNLTTDEKGEANFKVNFPDNITSWRSHALAMNGSKQSGTGFALTKAYKKLMATLSLPRFLVQGDSAEAVGKALNYYDDPVKIKTSFMINSKLAAIKDTILKDGCTQLLPFSSSTLDSLKLTFMLEAADGARDGEERKIPVYKKGVEETQGYFYALSRDTTITIETKNGQSEIYAQSNSFDFLLKELKDLQNYPHACMEQTASKLHAYLMEEKIMTLLKKKFNHSREVVGLLRKLKKGQKDSGGWGWWEDSKENVWMTAYILKIISKASAMGYAVEGIDKAQYNLMEKLPTLQGNELMTVLEALAYMHAKVPFEEYISKLEKQKLSYYQKLQVMKLKQNLDPKLDISELEKASKSTLLGNYYWSLPSDDWYDNSTNATLLAYEILKAKDTAHAYLARVRDYFLEIKKEHKWRNTIETAKILSTILPEMVKQADFGENTSLTMSGDVSETITKFPYKKKAGQVKKVTITKKGPSTVYFTLYETNWNETPIKKDDVFEIKTHYEVKEKWNDSIVSGRNFDLVVDLYVKKKCDYVMVEVPIPAGCSYDDNTGTKAWYESHREYYKNTTNIFCEELKEGRYTFRIKLQPRFKGVYTLNPAKTESMYFPVFYGRNEMVKVRIR